MQPHGFDILFSGKSFLKVTFTGFVFSYQSKYVVTRQSILKFRFSNLKLSICCSIFNKANVWNVHLLYMWKCIYSSSFSVWYSLLCMTSFREKNLVAGNDGKISDANNRVKTETIKGNFLWKENLVSGSKRYIQIFGRLFLLSDVLTNCF